MVRLPALEMEAMQLADGCGGREDEVPVLRARPELQGSAELRLEGRTVGLGGGRDRHQDVRGGPCIRGRALPKSGGSRYESDRSCITYMVVRLYILMICDGPSSSGYDSFRPARRNFTCLSIAQ